MVAQRPKNGPAPSQREVEAWPVYDSQGQPAAGRDGNLIDYSTWHTLITLAYAVTILLDNNTKKVEAVWQT